jgi:hypothetical protein
VADLEARLAAQAAQADKLVGEVAQLAWVIRYLPTSLRALVMDADSDDQHPYPRPGRSSPRGPRPLPGDAA